jgi:hypothetical protein
MASRRAAGSALIVLGVLAGIVVGATDAHAATTTINVNGTSAGRAFGGIGAISGGGGISGC